MSQRTLGATERGPLAAERAALPRIVGGDTRLHAGAWMAWMAAVAALAFLTSNPLYLAIAFIACAGVYLSSAGSARGRALMPVVVFGLMLALLGIPLNLITGSTGQHVLFMLPHLTFPNWFGGVTLGGSITSESLIAAGGRSLGIATLVVGAAAFNSGVNHFRLLKLAPPALAQVATVFTIAVLVVPQGVARAKAVAEGRRLRGRSIRGVRALAGLALPVMQGALEGAVQRAESLDARGFGGGETSASPVRSLVSVAGLCVFGWGSFGYFYYGSSLWSVAAMLLGAAIVSATLYSGGRRPRHSARPAALTTRDWLLLAAASTSVLIIVVLRVADIGDVTYLPYPDARWPAFNVFGAAAAVLLFAPALLWNGSSDL